MHIANVIERAEDEQISGLCKTWTDYSQMNNLLQITLSCSYYKFRKSSVQARVWLGSPYSIIYPTITHKYYNMVKPWILHRAVIIIITRSNILYTRHTCTMGVDVLTLSHKSTHNYQ